VHLRLAIQFSKVRIRYLVINALGVAISADFEYLTKNIFPTHLLKHFTAYETQLRESAKF